MPWSLESPLDLKTRFVSDYVRLIGSFTELCSRYGISRKTGYKWVERYHLLGLTGLEERSRRPHTCPSRVDPKVEAWILEQRRRHPSLGGKKLLTLLRGEHPLWDLPSRASVSRILKRHGMVKLRRRRSLPSGHPGKPVSEMNAPNVLWAADFKGHFRLGDGRVCYPLTVTDCYSRFLLACYALLSPNLQETWNCFSKIFREYGLPQAIRTDNGNPFAGTGLGRLSVLSVWWMRLGITPQLIQPGHPEQNGRHERMHRTLKEGTLRPPAYSSGAQQRRFDEFREFFNFKRPHEALGQRTPGALYRPSRNSFPAPMEPIRYPAHYERRYVRPDGMIEWEGRSVHITTVLQGQCVGLEPITRNRWTAYFAALKLGTIEPDSQRIEPAWKKRTRKTRKP
jgi:putative transposase